MISYTVTDHAQACLISHVCMLMSCNKVGRQACSVQGLDREIERPLEDPTGTANVFLPSEERVEGRGCLLYTSDAADDPRVV